MFAAMTDLFMNFALALVWVLFVMPAFGTDSLREQIQPEQASEGEAPAAGLSVATVTIDGKTGSLMITHKEEERTLSEFSQTQGGKDFPDHIVFRFLNLPEFDELTQKALERDCAISLKIKNPTQSNQ